MSAAEQGCLAAQVEPTAPGAAECCRGTGDVVAVERHDEGKSELFCDGEGAGCVQGEVRVHDGTSGGCKARDPVRSHSGLKIKCAPHRRRYAALLAEDDG